jgi:ribosomal protein L37AE/L43A
MLKNILKHPFAIALVSCLVFTPIGSAIYDHTKTIPVLTPILKVWNFIWLKIFNYGIPLYVSVILIVIVAIVVRNHFVFKIKLKEEMDRMPKKPYADYLQWKSGTFKRLTWIWQWHYNSKTNNYEVSGLVPVCNQCGYKMHNDPGYAIYRCPNCSNIYAGVDFENWFDIKSIIQQRLDKGDYPKV